MFRTTYHTERSEHRPQLASFVEPSVVFRGVRGERLLRVDLDYPGRTFCRSVHTQEKCTVRPSSAKSDTVSNERWKRKGRGGKHHGMMLCNTWTASSSVVTLGTFFCLAYKGERRALIAFLPTITTEAKGPERQKVQCQHIDQINSDTFPKNKTKTNNNNIHTFEVIRSFSVQQAVAYFDPIFASEKVDDVPLLGSSLP